MAARKKRMGRPPARDPFDAVISVRLTQDERELLRKAAGLVALSKWCRLALVEVAGKATKKRGSR